MNWMRSWFLLLFIAMPAFGQLQVEIDEGGEYWQAVIEKNNSLKVLQQAVVSEFHLERKVVVRFGSEDGPLYDPESHTIEMPWTFFDDIRQLMLVNQYVAAEEINIYVMDVIVHTLLHELGHALIEDLQLPVTVREEDAVDTLATLLLIDWFEEGHEMALSAADLFAMESEQRGELAESDFWGEHSLDEQRYFSGLCLIYGSDPERHTDLLSEQQREEQGEYCELEYQRQHQAWQQLLAPWLR